MIGRSSILSNCLNILIWIFQGFSLFSYQCSWLFRLLTALLFYQILSCLSTTFFFLFSVASFQTQQRTLISYHIIISLSTTFCRHSLHRSSTIQCVSRISLYRIACHIILVKIFFTFISLSLSKTKRRGWDSNPRALSDKRFSRPPRYDHFDTSPY